MKKILCVSLILLGGIASLLAQADKVSGSKTALEAILTNLNRASAETESWLEHPGWHDKTTIQALENFGTQYPGTDEALTAELWVAITKTDAGQMNPKVTLQNAAAFQNIATKSPGSWQAKIARLLRCATLFQAQQWDEFHTAANQTLTAINDYTGDSNEDYRRCLQMIKTQPAEIEPTMRHLLIMAARSQGKTNDALQYAEVLQSKFPEWSKQNHIADTVKQLKRGESPVRAR